MLSEVTGFFLLNPVQKVVYQIVSFDGLVQCTILALFIASVRCVECLCVGSETRAERLVVFLSGFHEIGRFTRLDWSCTLLSFAHGLDVWFRCTIALTRLRTLIKPAIEVNRRPGNSRIRHRPWCWRHLHLLIITALNQADFLALLSLLHECLSERFLGLWLWLLRSLGRGI